MTFKLRRSLNSSAEVSSVGLCGGSAVGQVVKRTRGRKVKWGGRWRHVKYNLSGHILDAITQDLSNHDYHDSISGRLHQQGVGQPVVAQHSESNVIITPVAPCRCKSSSC